MGMVWVARLADERQAATIMADPGSAYDFINPEEGWEEAAPDTLDLDKEWHGTHHMLTGSAGATDSPLSLIIGDFEQVGEDNGYGPAWYVPPARFHAFHEALSALDDAELRKRFDPNAMGAEQVYLGDVFQDEGDEAFDFLRERVNQLRSFAEKAATSGRGAFAVIT
jgi:hypothetical protein